METAALTIKVKGANAINALTSKGQLLGAAKLKGGAAIAKGATTAKLGLLHGAEIEGEGILAAKHGAVVGEFEGVYGGFAKGGAAAKGAAAKAAAAKAAAVKGAGAGGAWAGKGASFGLGWGLGALGPILVLGALGLGAVGIYLYRRNKKLEAEEMSFEEDDVALPTV